MIQETVLYDELEQVFNHFPKYRLASKEGPCSMGVRKYTYMNLDSKYISDPYKNNALSLSRSPISYQDQSCEH